MAASVPGPIPPFRTPQAVGSKTFTPPPLDTTLTLPQILDHHRRHSADHVFFRFEGLNGGYDTITWGDFVKATHRVAKLAISHAAAAGLSAADAQKPVFGVLAAADYITYITTVLGITRAGFVPFPISNRNSPAAVAHLVTKTNSQFVFTTPDAPTQGLIEASMATLDETSSFKPQLISLPTFQELYPESEGEFEYLEDLPAQELDSPVLILHSSGSTAFPKPIPQTHRNMLEHCRHPYYGGADLGQDVLAAHGLPAFHAIGVATTCWAASTGVQVGVFRPAFPPTIPTPQKVFDGILAVEATRAFAVPVFIEGWSKDEAQVEVMKNLRGVIYSGGPMNKAVGDALTAKGVQLRPGYGSTETGFMNVILPSEPMGEDWEYFEFSDHLKPGLLNDGSDAFEMHLLPCPSSTPAVVNTTWEGGPAYSTNDLLVRHATKPHLWKVFGRADDQIMLSTGEKTNPGPIEAILSRDPHIHAAIMFGRGRFQNGVIIEPKPQFQFDPADEEKLTAFRAAIWKTVDEANEYAPTHSRLFKEMIVVTSPGKPFQFTPKGTPKRQVILKEYDAEIDAVYKSVEESSLSDITAPTEWSDSETLRFVGDVVKRVLEEETIQESDDIFNLHGADSLQVTWIRNAILHALRTSKISVQAIPQNFVYNHPTIANLSRFIFRVANPTEGDSGKSELEYKIEELTTMVEKFTQDLPSHHATGGAQSQKQAKAPLSDVVFLTGTTGALGTNILAELVASPEVGRVYAFNRISRGGASLRDRHVASFKDRGIDAQLADSEKVVWVEGDATKADLGLSKELFEEIRDTTTHYIHNAWRVDFNVSLASFEPSIKSVRVLIDMALASPQPEPPRIMFTSSVATIRNYLGTTAYPEQFIEDPSLPAGAGYGESKWSAERILQIASQKTTLRPIIIRVGQLSGGANGAWNSQEWLPSIVKSGQIVKCLPDGTGNISWLPLHIAATSIVQMRDSESNVLHMAHPRPITWNDIFKPMAKALDVPLVPYNDWLGALDESLLKASSEIEAVKENPALRLIEFFRTNHADQVPPGHEAGGLPMLQTTLSVQNADALTEEKLSKLGDQDALSWISYWKNTGHLTA